MGRVSICVLFGFFLKIKYSVTYADNSNSTSELQTLTSQNLNIQH